MSRRAVGREDVLLSLARVQLAAEGRLERPRSGTHGQLHYLACLVADLLGPDAASKVDTIAREEVL